MPGLVLELAPERLPMLALGLPVLGLGLEPVLEPEPELLAWLLAIVEHSREPSDWKASVDEIY